MLMIVNILGICFIILIVYWFWLSQSKAKKAVDKIVVTVANGVYDPDVIEIPAQQALTMDFIRHDTSGCSEYVVFKDLDIHAQLPIDKMYPVNIPALTKGTYEFTCQMGMYRGKLVVK